MPQKKLKRGQIGVICAGIGVVLVFPGMTIQPLMIVSIVLVIVGMGLLISDL